MRGALIDRRGEPRVGGSFPKAETKFHFTREEAKWLQIFSRFRKWRTVT
jgi:hypothetical protein